MAPTIELAWGRRGAQAAALQRRVLAVVDVLSFSTAVVTACSRGASVSPCDWADDPAAVAAKLGAIAAVHRRDVPTKGRYSLSPQHMAQAARGERIVLASPNGASCAAAAREGVTVLLGALVNAGTCAAALQAEVDVGRDVTVLACGERWKEPHAEGELRFALEDYLGAGAILSRLRGELSADAHACARAFEASRGDIEALIRGTQSGQEFAGGPFAGDVDAAINLDRSTCVPRMADGWFI